MPSVLRAVRRSLLAPSLHSVGFAARGFGPCADEARARLEPVPRAVVCGFEWGMESRDLAEVEHRVDLVSVEHRGFVYEGVAMAYTVRAAMAGGRPHQLRDLLLGPASQHIFLTYIGIGFAMARLPRVLWSKIMPDLAPCPYHPTMSWLAVDGYAFDRAYFDTRRWIGQQRRPAPHPWLGSREYFPRAFDQGVGRALWFVHGADPAAVTAAVDRFDADRRADLWSGVGLAATFAGGCGPDGLAELRRRSETAHAELALGAIFALKARSYAGHVPEHTEHAVAALAGVDVADGLAIADATEVDPELTGDAAAYEAWRTRIRARFLPNCANRGG